MPFSSQRVSSALKLLVFALSLNSQSPTAAVDYHFIKKSFRTTNSALLPSSSGLQLKASHHADVGDPTCKQAAYYDRVSPSKKAEQADFYDLDDAVADPKLPRAMVALQSLLDRRKEAFALLGLASHECRRRFDTETDPRINEFVSFAHKLDGVEVDFNSADAMQGHVPFADWVRVMYKHKYLVRHERECENEYYPSSDVDLEADIDKAMRKLIMEKYAENKGEIFKPDDMIYFLMNFPNKTGSVLVRMKHSVFYNHEAQKEGNSPFQTYRVLMQKHSELFQPEEFTEKREDSRNIVTARYAPVLDAKMLNVATEHLSKFKLDLWQAFADGDADGDDVLKLEEFNRIDGVEYKFGDEALDQKNKLLTARILGYYDQCKADSVPVFFRKESDGEGPVVFMQEVPRSYDEHVAGDPSENLKAILFEKIDKECNTFVNVGLTKRVAWLTYLNLVSNNHDHLLNEVEEDVLPEDATKHALDVIEGTAAECGAGAEPEMEENV